MTQAVTMAKHSLLWGHPVWRLDSLHSHQNDRSTMAETLGSRISVSMGWHLVSVVRAGKNRQESGSSVWW